MTTIYFATNRDLLPAGDASPDTLRDRRWFGSNFSPDGLANLRFGKAEVTGADFDQIQVRVAPENLFADPPVLGSQDVFTAVRRDMQQGEDTVIFIHGFNTSFRDALTAAARLHQILTRPDPLSPKPLRLNFCLFSWPSDGNMLMTDPRSRDAVAYRNDRLDAAASGAAFARGFLKVADFINSLDQRCEQRIHLMAHSMGNYVLRYALQELRRLVADRLPRIFDQTFLMAADEDDEAFDVDHKLRQLPRLTRNTHVYFNRNDLALWASDRFKGNPTRLGTDGPLQPLQLPRSVYPVDCTDIISRFADPSEHGYYNSVERVAIDLRQILRGQSADSVRGRRYVPDSNRYRLLPDIS